MVERLPLGQVRVLCPERFDLIGNKAQVFLLDVGGICYRTASGAGLSPTLTDRGRNFDTTAQTTTDETTNKASVTDTLGDVALGIIKPLGDKVRARLDTHFLKSFFSTTNGYATKSAALNIRQSASDSLPNRGGVYTARSSAPDEISCRIKRCPTLGDWDTLKDAPGYPNFSSTKTRIEEIGHEGTPGAYLFPGTGFSCLDVSDTLFKALCGTDPIFIGPSHPRDLRSALRSSKPPTNSGHLSHATGDKERPNATNAASYINGKL